MSSSQKQWGGKLNPFIPVKDGAITDQWKEVAKWFDPDYIYYHDTVPRELVLQFIDEMRFNPADIEQLEPKYYSLKGIYNLNLLSKVNSPMNMLSANAFAKADADLQNYFMLNYGLNEHDYIPPHLGSKHHFIQISDKNFTELNRIIFEERISSNIWLGVMNSMAPYFRIEKKEYRGFELIIGKEGECNSELFYYWNKCFYDVGPSKPLSSFFITTKQLDLLLQDKFFKYVLDGYSGNEKQIDLVSFTLDDIEMMDFQIKLKKYSLHLGIEYRILPRFEFPYRIMDDGGLRMSAQVEQEKMDRFNSREFLLNIPALGFSYYPYSPDEEYALDFDIIEEIGFSKNHRRFPILTPFQHVIKVEGRISKKKQIVALIDNGSHRKGVLEITIPNLTTIISGIISNPIQDKEEGKILRHFVQFNDGSQRLLQFFKLFGNRLDIVAEFLNDRFWHDLFLGLTDNNKLEGDTITFKELNVKCKDLMKSEGFSFKADQDHPELSRHLEKGLKGLLQVLVMYKVFLPGYNVKCGQCSSKVWYSLIEISNKVICKGCFGENEFKVETPIAYKLNHLVKNNFGMKDEKGIFAPDGNLTAIKTLLHLHSSSTYGFDYSPQLDVYLRGGGNHPLTDLDIVALAAGQLFIGECKNNSNLFSQDAHKCLNHLLYLAKLIKPDVLIISCTKDENDKLNKAKKYLERHLSKWETKPPKVQTLVVPEPTYFRINDYHYFKE